MYEISVETQFAAAHALRLPDGSVEPFHGHNWHLTTSVAGERLDEIESVMDFHDLERMVEQVVGPWRNANLNDMLAFGPTGVNPSAERVAEHVGNQVQASLPSHVWLSEVAITEAPGCTARYRPTRPS